MSIRIWKEIADQKKQVENQRERILNAFKQRSVEDQMGTIKAEKLFQPITKLMGKPRKEEKPFPDYDIDDQTRNFKNELPFVDYPFEQEEDPADLEPAPEEEDPADLEPAPEEFGEEVLPGEKQQASLGSLQSLPPSAPSYSEATKDDPPPKYKEPRADDSNDLSTLNKFMKNNEGNPDAIIKTSKSPFLGYDVEQAKYAVYEIYTERAKKVLEKGDRKTAIGQKDLGPYEGKSNKEMRAMIGKFEKGKAQTGSGFNTLINRLSLGISSIVAGNTSVKLKKEIKAIANHLEKQGVISKEQTNKVFSLK